MHFGEQGDGHLGLEDFHRALFHQKTADGLGGRVGSGKDARLPNDRGIVTGPFIFRELDAFERKTFRERIQLIFIFLD
jgi:hypothetical protein